ncbi:MAG: hypothetical protein OXI74_05720 [Rhodospirillaceae bacterium]|nr:hypothetical protein [Rhodospirillaceae bacterium]
MYGVIEKRIGELHGVKARLEARLRQVVADIAYFEEAAQRASHPLDVCVCRKGTCACSGPFGAGDPAASAPRQLGSLEDCEAIEEVCEHLAVNNPNGTTTIKLGDAVRACKQRGWDPHINNNSYRSKVAKRLDRSDQWEFLGDGTYRFLGRAAEGASAKAPDSTGANEPMAA